MECFEANRAFGALRRDIFESNNHSYILTFNTGFLNFTYSSSACDFALSVSRLGIDGTALSTCERLFR